MVAYSMTTFVNDSGARTEIINANPMNANFNHVLAAMPPIGSIIPFYDFNAALTFNSSYWAYCDGSAATISGIGSQTLPDLSNRYLVGFGTEGGGDIDTAAWATVAVGNASHQVDISHTHTGPSHTHTGPSHTHDVDIASFTSGAGSAHLHSTGGFTLTINEIPVHDHMAPIGVLSPTAFGTAETTSGNRGNYGGSTSGATTYDTVSDTGGGASHNHRNTGSESSHTHSIDPGNTTSTASGTGVTGASGAGATGSSLSATQSIQLRSIRVRFIIRIL